MAEQRKQIPIRFDMESWKVLKDLAHIREIRGHPKSRNSFNSLVIDAVAEKLPEYRREIVAPPPLSRDKVQPVKEATKP